jgi:hypothetical protein
MSKVQKLGFLNNDAGNNGKLFFSLDYSGHQIFTTKVHKGHTKVNKGF